jgi:acetyl-CoA C-acetyltransferase
MTAVLEKALAFNEIRAENLDHVEFYSCFPSIPRMARRILNWPLDSPHSVYGGLTFGGAPVGNCMMHAAAAMVQKLRCADRGEQGLIFANGGFATHNHAIVLTRRPGPRADQPQPYDVQATADALRSPGPTFLGSYFGPGTIETYVMPYNRLGDPEYGTVLGRAPSGERFLAFVPAEDRAMLNFLTGAAGEPVGSAGTAILLPDGRARWTS